MRRPRGAWTVATVVVALVAANVAYALAVPAILDARVPARPLGIRGAPSLETDAGTTFVDVTAHTGIVAHRYEWKDADLPYPAVITGGLAASDVDGDGLVDLFFAAGGPTHPASMWRNKGGLVFEDVTDAAGLRHSGFGAGAVFGDYDRDGDKDLFALVDGRGLLYRNDGGRFTDVASDVGASLEGACGQSVCQPSAAAWLDFDRDGDLDLYVANNLDWRDGRLGTSGQDYASLIRFASAQRSVLLRNDAGAFVDVTLQADAWDTGKGLGVTPRDVDGDGWDDILTANDISPNAFFRNQGDGSFRDRGPAIGLAEVKSGMGIQADDVDGDGLVDVVVTNFRGDGMSLLMQRPDGRFVHETESRGLGRTYTATGWGVQLMDIDLDGWLDIAHGVGRAVPLEPHERDLHNVLFPRLKEEEADQLYRNMGAGMFRDATASAGDFRDDRNTRALLGVDLDNDGDLDIVRVNVQGHPAQVLRNDLNNGHGWLQLLLEGTASNTDGFGAHVHATLPDGRTLAIQSVSSASYQTGLPGILTLGLGDAQEAHVVVRWPSGAVQDVGTLATGSHTVREPALT